MSDEKKREVVPDTHELVKQSINAVGRMSHQVDRLYQAMHLSEVLKGCDEEAEHPMPERGSIEDLEYDVSCLRTRIDVLEGRLVREMNYLLGSS